MRFDCQVMGVRTTNRRSRLPSLVLLLLGLPLWAVDPLNLGLQVGLAIPLTSDLKVTTSPGPAPSLGFYAEYPLSEAQALRARLDWTFFPQGTQVSDSPGLRQQLDTSVKSESLAVDYLVHPSWLNRRWSLGGSVSLIRWTVDSSNRLETPVGVFVPSGSSDWTRAGWGLLTNYRWADQAEVEFRFVASHFGQQNLPARVASLNLLLHF